MQTSRRPVDSPIITILDEEDSSDSDSDSDYDEDSDCSDIWQDDENDEDWIETSSKKLEQTTKRSARPSPSRCARCGRFGKKCKH
jgi:hypothetical protein